MITGGWLRDLEDAATSRQGGTRYWFEALVAAVKFIKRVNCLFPEVPEQQLQGILSHPKVLAQIQETLQQRDVEGSRQELIRSSLSPSTGRGSEGLRVLCSYMEQTDPTKWIGIDPTCGSGRTQPSVYIRFLQTELYGTFNSVVHTPLSSSFLSIYLSFCSPCS